MSKNIQVLDIKPSNSLVSDSKTKNSLVLDIKPNENVFGETAWTAVELSVGQSIGPGLFFPYVTYPTYSLNRIN